MGTSNQGSESLNEQNDGIEWTNSASENQTKT